MHQPVSRQPASFKFVFGAAWPLRVHWRKIMAAGLIGAGVLASGPAFAQNLKQFSGMASYYSKDHTGQVASGPRYDPTKFTAAHRSLPFGTQLRVSATGTKRSVMVVVNDRGPFIKGRVIDLSYAAAKELRMIDRGLIPVTVAVQ